MKRTIFVTFIVHLFGSASLQGALAELPVSEQTDKPTQKSGQNSILAANPSTASSASQMPAGPPEPPANISPYESQFKLEGRIHHANALPAVDPKLKPGAKFDYRRLPFNHQPSLLWWRVPEWLSGTWHNSGKVKRLSFVDLDNPEKKEGFNALDITYPDSEIIGYQEDKSGAVWTAVMTPYMGRTHQGENTNISVIHSAVPLEVSPHQVVLRFLATTAIVNTKTKRISSVSQRESIQTYRPADANRVIVLSSMKFFDSEGHAKYQSELLSHCHRQLPYHELQFLPTPQPLTLIDLRQSFVKFLRHQQLESLVPERKYSDPPVGYNVIVP